MLKIVKFALIASIIHANFTNKTSDYIYRNLIITMTQTHSSLELKDLEDKLDKLIAQYQSVKNENSSLKTKQEVLVMEKAKLLEKTTIARTRVEAMITRLKEMEQGS
jgi:cell division protein ZapB